MLIILKNIKAIDDSCTQSITTQQRDRLHQLRHDLGLSNNSDVNAVTGMVKQVSEGTLEVLSFHIDRLE